MGMGKQYAALLTLSLIWGTSFLFIKLLVGPLGAWGVVFWRCFFGTAILLLIVTIRREWKGLTLLPIWTILLLSLLNNAIPWALIAWSETKISSSYASLINATTPIWTVIIGYFFFYQKLRWMQWLGILFGFVGIVILTEVQLLNLFNQPFIGLFTMLGATICYGFSTHISKKYLKNISITLISVSTLLMSTIISFFIVLLTHPSSFSKVLDPSIFFSLIGLGVFGSGIAYILYYYIIQEGSPEFASLVTYMVPITALLWGYLFLSETISLMMIVGFIIIISGVYFSSKKPKLPDLPKRATA
jgi:drug/metabolite transporter (DMT)-like permease